MKFGTTELIMILVVVVIIFGPTQLPKLAKMFGRSVKNFREAADARSEKDDAETPEE